MGLGITSVYPDWMHDKHLGTDKVVGVKNIYTYTSNVLGNIWLITLYDLRKTET